MNREIYQHDNDIDVTHKINTIELDNWINHLEYISKEMSNLLRMSDMDFNEKFEDDILFKKLQKKEIENNTLLKALKKYAGSRMNIAECDDTQCDMVYINEHETYRRSYLYHLDKYRKLKDEFFTTIQGKFTSSKIDSINSGI